MITVGVCGAEPPGGPELLCTWRPDATRSERSSAIGPIWLVAVLFWHARVLRSGELARALKWLLLILTADAAARGDVSRGRNSINPVSLRPPCNEWNKPRLRISTQRCSSAKKVQLGVNVKIKEALIVLSLNKTEKDPPLEPLLR